MKDRTFSKDKTPYLIFACKNCKQYMYVKTTQKGKKCLRCGHTHTVSNISNDGEMVKGMTAAVDAVKQKQHEFGTQELGNTPEFRAFGDFKVSKKKISDSQLKGEKVDNEAKQDYSSQFTAILKEISKSYKKFPAYVLEIMAERYGIPLSTLHSLRREFQEKGILLQLDGYSYKLNL